VPPLEELTSSILPKNPQIEELFEKAKAGTLQRSRPLKPWEPEVLSETALHIILLRATGMRQHKIVEFMNDTLGTNLSDSSVSQICNHPDAQTLLTKLVSYAADEVIDIQTKIKAYAGEGIDEAARIMRVTNDQRLAAKIAFEFLDRAGYNTVQKTESKVTIVASKKGIENLAAAMRGTQVEVEGSYVVLPDKILQGEGSGNSLAGSESAASGQLADVPPISASPSQSKKAARLGADLEPEDQKFLEKRAGQRVA